MMADINHKTPGEPALLKTSSASTRRPKRTVRWLVASAWTAGAIVSVAVLVGMTSVAKPPEVTLTDPVDTVLEILPGEVFAVAPTDLAQTIRVVGSLSPARRVDLSAQVSGTVQAVSVRTGETISAGAELVRIDVEYLDLLVDQQRAALKGVIAQHDAAVSDLERKRRLAEQQLLSIADLQAAETQAARLASDIAALEAQLRQAQTNLGRASIAAPFDGIVATRVVEPGQTISAGSSLLTLVDQSVMVAEVVVPLMESASLRVGQDVALTIRGMEAQTFPASVERISPIAEGGTRSVKVFLTLDNPDSLLRGGMFVTGDIEVATAEQAIAIPHSAVSVVDGQEFVMTIRDGVAEQRPVVVSRAWPKAGLIEIADGLQAGELVLAARLPQVVDGSAVQLVEGL